jgi:S1-C subfamily serine protease
MDILKKLILLSLMLFSTASLANTSNLYSAGVPSLAPMLENVTSAVVNIYTISEVEGQNNYIDDPFLRKFFNIPEQQKSKKKIGQV